jgi:hypothetical protein
MSKMTTYETLDNGGKPFVVCVFPSNVEIYKQKLVNEYEKPYWVMDKKVQDTPYKEIWIGDNTRNEKGYAKKGLYPGNAVLIQTADDKYMFVGHKRFSFRLKGDAVVQFCSPVGNSEVPYPYIIGKERIYFILDRKSVLNELFQDVDDYYGAFYGMAKGVKSLF